MNKKLITLAVAAALAAPAAAMAEATLYGVINQSIDYIDQDDVTVEVTLPDGTVGSQEVEGFAGWSVNRADGTIIPTNPSASLGAGNDWVLGGGNGPVGPSNRVGVKGSEDLGNGLKAIYQIEFGIATSDRNKAAMDGDRGTAVSMRNTFAGLAGDWGTFLVGRHDTPLKISTAKLDLFADTMGDYNGPLAFDDIRADNTIAYISPSWSGFQLAAAIIPGGCATATGNRLEGSGCGATLTTGGSGYNKSDSLAEGYSIAAIYSNGPWYASAAYEGMQSDLGGVSDGFTLANGDTPFDDYNKYRLGLGVLDWNGFSFTGIWEDRSNYGFVQDWDTQSWEIQLGYSFGNNMIKGSYGQLLRDLGNLWNDGALENDGDLDSWSVGFDHNFSKRTKVYAIYTGVNDELDLPNFTDWQGFSMGIVHKF